MRKRAEGAQGWRVGQEEEPKFGEASPQRGERENSSRDSDSDWETPELQLSEVGYPAEGGLAQDTSQRIGS